MFYMGGMTFGYLQPPKPASVKTDDAASEIGERPATPQVEIAAQPRKSADSTPFLWVRQWMM